jgi:hypothetical protein
MSKLAYIAVLLCSGLLLAACIEKASEEQHNKMCENLVKLRGEVDTSTAEERTVKVNEKFAKEEKRLVDWMEKDLNGWDEELNSKLAEIKDENEKKALVEEYDKKKEDTKAQHIPGIEELKPQKEAALKEAKKKAEESRVAWTKAVGECMTAAVKEGTSKKVAECRIGATSVDQYWNMCR